MYEEFLKQIEDFIFIEDKPEKADVIFVPGNGYPQMAEKAAQLYRCGMRRRYFQAGDTVLQLENLQECWKKKNIIPGLIRQNGNF